MLLTADDKGPWEVIYLLLEKHHIGVQKKVLPEATHEEAMIEGDLLGMAISAYPPEEDEDLLSDDDEPLARRHITMSYADFIERIPKIL